MADIWKNLEYYLSVYQPDTLASLKPPATDIQIHELQEKVGIILPFNFVEALKTHDGQKGVGDPLFDEYSFLPIKEILMNWFIMNDLLDGGDFKDTTPESSPAIQSVWWSRYWIPFADNGAGDLLCLDMAPTTQGTIGQVIEFFHDMPERNVIAPNFQEWFETFVKNMISD